MQKTANGARIHIISLPFRGDQAHILVSNECFQFFLERTSVKGVHVPLETQSCCGSATEASFLWLTVHRFDVPHDGQFQGLLLQRHCVGAGVSAPLQAPHRDEHRRWGAADLFLLKDNWWTVFTKTGHFHKHCACRCLTSVFCKKNKEIQRVDLYKNDPPCSMLPSLPSSLFLSFFFFEKESL